MQLGIAPPIVNCSTNRSADWETGGSGADLIAIAQAGERFGVFLRFHDTLLPDAPVDLR